MTSRLARLIGCSFVWALCACADKPTEVELRLYPCMLASGAPTSVELTIRSYDAASMTLGGPLTKSFPIEDQGVFDDDYATVGFTPPAGAVRADITVVWQAGDEAVAATYNLPVPALGDFMNLGMGECEGGPGTTTTPTTDDPTATSGPDTTDSTTGPGTSTGTGTTGTSDPTETTSTSTSTSTSTGDTETTDPGTTTSTTTEMSTTDMTTGTSGGPIEGGDCEPHGSIVCAGGPGVLGDLLYCEFGTWVLNNDFCSVDACSELAFNNPQTVGCLGSEQAWSCACADTPQGECTMGMQSACGGPLSEGVLVELCVEDGGNTWHYAAQCPDCIVVDGQPLCTL